MNIFIMADKYTETLTNNGVPKDIAVKVSEILEKDDPNKSDLGRTEADQKLVIETLPYLQRGGTDNE